MLHYKSRTANTQSKRFIERKNARIAAICVLVFTCIMTWGFTLSRASELRVFAIQDVIVNGVESDLAKDIENAARSAIEGSYLGLFSKKNGFIYPQTKVAAVVRAISPEITNVSVSTKGRNLIIDIEDKDPSALVCIGFPDLTTDFNEDASDLNDECYFADSDGLLYAISPKFSGQVYNRFFIPALSSKDDVEKSILGSYATSTELFHSLLKIFETMSIAHIKVEAILVKDDGEFELFTYSGPNNLRTLTVVYFNSLRSLDEQAENVVSFWKEMVNSKPVQQSPAFEYIDVRYGSNVYYRMR